MVTFDGRGNGRSDRPPEPEAYAETEYAADALAVLDATETDSAILVAWSVGAQRAVVLAAEQPARVSGIVLIGPAVPIGAQLSRAEAMAAFDELRPPYEGWFKFNRHYWMQNYEDFLSFFFSQVFTDPHSTKQIEDAVGWGKETIAGNAHRHRGWPGGRRANAPRACRAYPLPRARHSRDRRRHPFA